MTEQDRNLALSVRRPSRRRWPWFLGGVVVLAILANLTGITPYGILMHKDDHVGASNRCSAGKTTLAEAQQRSTTLLTEAANAVAAGALLKAPRIDSRHAEGRNLDECFTVTGYQDLPDSIERQAGTAARIADLWTGAGYQKLSPTSFRTLDGYVIELDATGGRPTVARYYVAPSLAMTRPA